MPSLINRFPRLPRIEPEPDQRVGLFMRFSSCRASPCSPPFRRRPALASEAAEPFAASRDPAARERALECLTQAVYYEARSESDDGQRAVAQVVLNRVRHPAYPNSVCGVVYQGSERAPAASSASPATDRWTRGIEPYAWDRARRIAEAALAGASTGRSGSPPIITPPRSSPYWAPSLVPQTVVGAHIFYRRPGGSGTSGRVQPGPRRGRARRGGRPCAAAAPRAARARSRQASYEMPVRRDPGRRAPGARAHARPPAPAPLRQRPARIAAPPPVRAAPRVVIAGRRPGLSRLLTLSSAAPACGS